MVACAYIMPGPWQASSKTGRSVAFQSIIADIAVFRMVLSTVINKEHNMSFMGGLSRPDGVHEGRFLLSLSCVCCTPQSHTTASNAIQSRSMTGTQWRPRVPVLFYFPRIGHALMIGQDQPGGKKGGDRGFAQ
jgi:hypothetical protein